MLLTRRHSPPVSPPYVAFVFDRPTITWERCRLSCGCTIPRFPLWFRSRFFLFVIPLSRLQLNPTAFSVLISLPRSPFVSVFFVARTSFLSFEMHFSPSFALDFILPLHSFVSVPWVLLFRLPKHFFVVPITPGVPQLPTPLFSSFFSESSSVSLLIRSCPWIFTPTSSLRSYRPYDVFIFPHNLPLTPLSETSLGPPEERGLVSVDASPLFFPLPPPWPSTSPLFSPVVGLKILFCIPLNKAATDLLVD